MTFVAAAFLAGFAVLAVPLWLHRMNERAPAQATVTSLMLMREAEEPVRTRRALAHRMLLALRLALLALLTLAFAQPVIDLATDAAGSGTVAPTRLIVIDSSLSMRRPGAWAEALATAEALRGGSESGHRLMLASDRLTLIDDLERAAPGWSRLDFGGLAGRLDAAIAGLPEPPGGWLVHLISDFQARAVPTNFNALVAGARWPMALHAVGAAGDNWAVESVTVVGQRLDVVVAGFAQRSRSLTVAVRRLDDGAEQRATVRVAAGSRSRAGFDIVVPEHTHAAWQVSLGADDAIADDDVGVAVASARSDATVAVIAPNAAPTALAFLVAALDASGFGKPTLLQADSPWRRSPDAVIVLDPGALAEPLRRRLDRHLENGGGALVIAGPRSERAATLPLGGETGIGVQRDASSALHRSGLDLRRVVVADAGHPLAEGSWHDVEVERALRIMAADDETILELASTGGADDAAAPLLIERRIGKGRALVLLTALDRSWSSLVLRPAFVEMIGNAVRYLRQSIYLAAYAGQAVYVPAASVQIFDVEGRRVLALEDTIGQPVVRVDEPGIYTVRTPGRESLMAVNVDPRESDPRPVSDDFLARWQDAALAPAASKSTGGGPSAADAAPEPMPLAPWLLAVAALLLIAESVAANMGRLNLTPPWRKKATS